MKKRRFSETFPYDTRWGFTTEMEVYEHIWLERPHASFISGQPISRPSPKNFLHVLPKALDKYPHFRLNPDNIILGTWDEHDLLDAGTEAKRSDYPGDWNAVRLLEEQLKQEYETLYGTISK